jgi:hypothetical protein
MSRSNVNRKPAVNPEGSWANASYELTWAIDEVTDQPDLIVKIAPDAAYDDTAYDADGNLITDPMTGEVVASQHAAITFLELRVVEINPKLLPEAMREDPVNFHPLSRQDRKNYPVVWGAAVHEAAHANHSNWVVDVNKKIRERKLNAQERQWAGAAMLLEESRIEKNQIDARPQDQPWIEAAGMHVAVTEYAEACKAAAQFKTENPDADDVKLSRYKCGRAAALALARVDSGSVFRTDKIDEIEGIVRDAFGDKDFDELREIWLAAQACDDDDAETMLELGHRWFDLTQDAGDDQQPMGIAIEMDGDNDGDGSEGDGLGKALADGAKESEDEASGKADEDRRNNRINMQRQAARTEAAAQRQATAKASQVFGGGAGDPDPYSGHPVIRYRTPTREEVNRARMTRRRLQSAYVPEKTVTKVTNPLPPGRMSTWALHQRNLQRRAGIVPTAEPYTYMDRKHVTTPPLKVGIVQDVSGSQSGAAAAAVSGAWSLAKAANDIPDAKIGMVSFGNDVHSIIKPLTKVTKVPVINANAGTHYFLDALRAIEGELELTRSGAARLLVILTDGDLAFHDIQGRDAALRRLTGFGVKVLWVDTDGYGNYLPRKMPGLHIFDKASGNYDSIPSVICHEAVTALTK